jgi:hypothetical protein
MTYYIDTDKYIDKFNGLIYIQGLSELVDQNNTVNSS